MKPALLIMAAGMGSRFGGLKQIEPMGPEGATLLDYSIFDALRVGFGKVVFIIRRDIEDDFKKAVGRKWEKRVSVRYVFQELGMVPEGFRVPEARQKPWGTGHAIWVAQNAIQEPFAVINADDYYGRSGFKVLAEFLKKSKSARYAMVGFLLKKTLSDHGPVSRGVCQITSSRFLKKVIERTRIEKKGSQIGYLDEREKKHLLTGKETVSMNMWGFTPALFGQLEKGFHAFLKQKGREEKSEFLIPAVVDGLIQKKKATVKVLPTKDPWFGMTYPQDKEFVRGQLQRLIHLGKYPEKLWD
jgi:NDP-sugar pyrophosphorylase family protein